MWEALETIEFHFYNFIIALVILLLGLTLGLIIRKILLKVLHEIELDKFVQRLGKAYSLEKKISSLASYLIYFLALLLFLNQLGITSIIIYIILAAILLVISASLLLGIKDFIPNLFAGLALSRQKRWKKGKKIKVNEVEGTIEKLGLLETEIKTEQGDIIYLPNSLLVKSKVQLKK